jgi:hypothetical protein
MVSNVEVSGNTQGNGAICMGVSTLLLADPLWLAATIPRLIFVDRMLFCQADRSRARVEVDQD